ncbi:MAG: leucine-rich repeat domain-containing protein [Rikenellaceae bacterium]|nr:leucine-rich repeat domain-containing protein [Rikenellaceae bacterium]
MGDSAFAQCISLTSVTIPDSVNTIGGSAFSQCVNLKEFKGKFATDDGRCLIVDGVLNSFAIGCGDTEYTIPDSVNTIGHTAFGECTSLTSITIPDSVKTIEGWAFGYCTSLESVTIPDRVTTIGNYAFVQCYSLTSVTIPDSVKTIGGSAFHSCNNLTSVYCKATTPPSLGDYEVFAFNSDNRKIIVPSESLSAYRGAVGWSHYADDIVSEDWGNLDTPNVVISDQNDTTITLSWDAIEGASEYTLSIEGSIYGPYTTTETSYTFELPDAGSYSISVQAFDDEDNASYPVSIEFVMGDPNLADWFTQKLMTTAEIEEHGMDPSTIIAFTWKGKNIVDFRYYANVTSNITGIDDSVIIQNMHSFNDYLAHINSAEGLTSYFSGLYPNTSYTIFAYAVNDKGAKLLVREERTTAASL